MRTGPALLWLALAGISILACDAAPNVSAGVCDFPTPRVAVVDDLADNPAQCGQDPFIWSRANLMGQVVDYGIEVPYLKDLLDLVIVVADLELPYETAYDVNLQQIAYVTQDRGEEVVSTAIIAYPLDVPEDEPLDIFLMLHGTSGFTHGCGPSSDDDMMTLAAVVASSGWVVVAPDFIGLEGFRDPIGSLHPYLVGQATAIASLDAARAARSISVAAGGDLCVAPRVAVWGPSQGGHAALWVDRLQPYYAPELELVGVVAAVPPADVLGQMQRALQSKVDATGNMAAFYGASASWYGIEDRLDEVFLPPYDTSVPPALGRRCDPADELGVDDIELHEGFTPEILAAAAAGELGDYGPWGCIARESGLTTTSIPRINETPDAYGILYLLGGEDELVNTPIEREAFGELCRQGMPLQYLECEGADHVDAVVWAAGEAFGFLLDRAAGLPFEGQCAVAPPTVCSNTPDE